MSEMAGGCFAVCMARHDTLAVIESFDAISLDRFARRLLEQPYVLFIFRRDEADGVAFRFRAAGATDAMNVVLGMHRKIEVDHVRDAFDVDAARGDVSGNKHAYATVAKRGER